MKNVYLSLYPRPSRGWFHVLIVVVNPFVNPGLGGQTPAIFADKNMSRHSANNLSSLRNYRSKKQPKCRTFFRAW